MPDPGNSEATLVLVDDDHDDAHMLRTAAVRGGLAVRILHLDRGLGLLEALARHELPPRSLVLLDLNMPTMDGFAVLARLRDRPHTPPIVAYSTSSDRVQIDRAYAAGANAYLTKPQSLSQTIALLAALLAHWFVHGRLPSVERRP